MAKSRSRKGKPGKPNPGDAKPVPTDASVFADDADRTVILPGADSDPTLTPPIASDSSATPAVADSAPVPVSTPATADASATAFTVNAGATPGKIASSVPAGADATPAPATVDSRTTSGTADSGTTPVKAEPGVAAAATGASGAAGGSTAPAVAERKELVGSLRSKEQQRARDKARGKGKEPAAQTASGGLLEWLKSVAAAILLFFVIRTFLITAYSIPSESMEETLLVGDYLMANNALFGATLPFTDIKLPALRDPRRGEIVVFRPTYNEPQIDVVKRVVGTPGDTLQMADGVLFLNGRRMNERYAHYDQGYDEDIQLEGFGLMDPNIIPAAYGAKNHLPLLLPTVDKRQYRPSRNTWGPLVVPAGHYWLMGDNRDQSLDSRFMGPIPRRVIRGKPLFIYYSYDRRDLSASFPSFITAARWGRIGDRIR